MTVPNRAPSTVWCLRPEPGHGYVATADDDLIRLVVPQHPGDRDLLMVVWLPRADARLLAKRINECLDATVKR